MLKRAILIMGGCLALAAAALGQAPTTNVGGPIAPQPLPDIQTTGNLFVDADFEADTAGAPPAAPWTLVNCGAEVVTAALGGKIFSGSQSLAVGPCGNAANGSLKQTIPWCQGIAAGGACPSNAIAPEELMVSFHLYTGNAVIGNYISTPINDVTHLGGLMATDEGPMGPMQISTSSGGADIAPVPNTNFFVNYYRGSFINTLPHAGDQITPSIQFLNPGIGTTSPPVYVDAVAAVGMDHAIVNIITYPNFHGYVSEQPTKFTCPTCTGLSVTGVAVVNQEWNGTGQYPLSNYTLQVFGGDDVACVANQVSIYNAAPTSRYTPWKLNVSSFPVEALPTTPHYICARYVNNATAAVFQAVTQRYYVVSLAFVNSLPARFRNDLALLEGGLPHLVALFYDSLNTNRIGSFGPGSKGAFSTTTASGTGSGLNGCTSTADVCYKLWFAGMNPTLTPQALTNRNTSGEMIIGPSDEYINDIAALGFDALLNYSNASAYSPIYEGGFDQLSPYESALGSVGIQHVQITNFLADGIVCGQNQDTVCDTAGLPSTMTITPSSTGGTITTFPGPHVHAILTPTTWNTPGQGGSKLLHGPGSPEIISSATMPGGPTQSLQVTMPACVSPAQTGWQLFLGIGTASPNSGDQIPFNSDDSMYPFPWYRCGLTYTITTLTPVPVLPPANDFTAVPAAPVCSGCTFLNETAAVFIQAVEPGGLTGQSTPISATVGATLAMPSGTNPAGCPAGTTWTGYYVSQANESLNASLPGSPTVYFLQGTVGTPLPCGGSYTVLSSTAMSTSVQAPVDTTVSQRPGWVVTCTGSVCTPNNAETDAGVYQEFGGSAAGLNTNFPSPAKGFLGWYPADEPGALAQFRDWQQIMGTGGLLGYTPGAVVLCVLGVPADFLEYLGVCDAPSSDPYCCGRPPLSEGTDEGGGQRNGTDIYCYISNTLCQPSGTTNGGAFNLPQMTRFAAEAQLYQTLGAKPQYDIADDFQVVMGPKTVTVISVSITGSVGTATCSAACGYSTHDVMEFLNTGIVGLDGVPVVCTVCSSGLTTVTFASPVGSGTSSATATLYFINSERGFTCLEMSKAVGQGLVTSGLAGGKGFGYGIFDGSNLAQFVFNWANTNTWNELQCLNQEETNPHLNRLMFAQMVDSTLSTALPQFNSPGLGQIITNIEVLSTTVANTPITPSAACSPTPLSANSYANTTIYQHGPVNAWTTVDPADGLSKFEAFAWGCTGPAGNDNGSGGHSAVIRETWNSTMIPPGATTWSTPFQAGGPSGSFGSNGNCPLDTVTANQICFVVGDYDVDWILVQAAAFPAPAYPMLARNLVDRWREQRTR